MISLLLLLLPMQFAFASAAGYCAAERAGIASHFGHHDHPDSNSGTGSDSRKSGPAEGNCGICHLGCAKAQPAAMASLVVPGARFARSIADALPPDHPQDPFDRPPRLLLA